MKFAIPIRLYIFTLVVTAILPFVVLLALENYTEIRSRETELRDSVLHSAHMLARETAVKLASIKNRLAALTMRAAGHSLDPVRCGTIPSELLRLIPEVTHITLLNDKGMPVCLISSLTSLELSEPYLDAETLSIVSSANSPVLGEPFFLADAAHWKVALVQPIQNEEQRFIGAIHAQIDLALFRPAAEFTTLPLSAVAVIIESKGRVIARSSAHENWVGRDARGTEIVDQVLQRKEGTTIAYGLDRTEKIYGYAQIPETEWFVYIGIPTAQAFARTRSEMLGYLALAVLTLFVSVFLAVFANHKITAPILHLAHVAQSRGQGSLDARVRVRGPTEIRHVAQAFNEMADARNLDLEIRSARELQQAVVVELGVRALSGIDLQTLMNDATQMIARVLDVVFCSVLELMPGGESLLLRAGVGWDEESIGKAMVSAGTDSPAGYTLTQDRPVIVTDLRTETRFTTPPLLRDYGIVSGMSVVVQGYDKPFGVLGTYATVPTVFTKNDVNFLSAVSNVLANAIARKRGEEALRDSEARYRTLFELAPVGIAIYQDGEYVLANSACARLYGASDPAEMSGRPFTDFIHPDDHDLVERRIREILEEGKIVSLVPQKRLRLDGTVIDVEVAAMPLTYKGRPAVQAVFHDITERKRAEEQREGLVRELQTLSQRLVETEENERRVLARELHDRVGQTLTALSINLNVILNQITRRSALIPRLNDSLNLVEQTVQLVRNVMADLRPAILDDYGLAVALEWYGKQFTERTGVAVHVSSSQLEERLTTAIETTLFRIAQEALTNCAKHARAQHAVLLIEQVELVTRLTIADDGVGFDSSATAGSKGWGLITMRERARAVGGDLRVQSSPGQGTKVIVEIKDGS